MGRGDFGIIEWKKNQQTVQLDKLNTDNWIQYQKEARTEEYKVILINEEISQVAAKITPGQSSSLFSLLTRVADSPTPHASTTQMTRAMVPISRRWSAAILDNL